MRAAIRQAIESFLETEPDTPSDDDYQFHQPRYWAQWMAVDDYWRCPACRRTKRQILRRDSRNGKWHGEIVMHHDHGTESGRTARFQPVLICQQCNQVDAACKFDRPDFSLSPEEIHRVILARPHCAHLINATLAHLIMFSVL
jgi:hypothetical protein